MGLPFVLPTVILAVALNGWGDGRPSPPSLQSRGAESALKISGAEWLGWEQRSRAAEIAKMQFAALVDGRRLPLEAATCLATNDPRMFLCSAPLPVLQAGPHAIQLVAIADGRESRPSTPPLSVILEAGSAEGHD
jgi:hypothetical protein